MFVYVSAEELKKIIEAAEKAGCCCEAISQLVADEGNTELCLFNMNNALAYKIWTSEDIYMACEELGYEATDELVADVLAKFPKKALEDCSDDWEILYSVVRECSEPTGDEEPDVEAVQQALNAAYTEID